MKYLLILVIAAFGLNVSAQEANLQVNKLMEQELKMIQKDLSSQEEPQVLSTEQTKQLKELLLVKSEKVNAIRESKQDKLEMSQNLTSINKEFEPAILAIFNSAQKKAYKASARNKRKFTKVN